MKRYALIGGQLGHSWSPQIHEAFFRLTGIEGTYSLVPLAPDRLAEGTKRLIAESDGFNVTIPYKQQVIPLLDMLDPVAEYLGAVNTVLTGRTSMGCNTDLPGFLAMIRRAGIGVEGRRCFILGTGGVSRAAEAALRMLGAGQITFVSRNPSEGQIGYDALAEAFSGVLVNATPAGMKGFPAACPVDDAALRILLPRCTAVVDIVANPLRTPLMRRADAAGIPNCGGLSMLVAQAMEAQRLWQGWEEVSPDLTDAVLRETIQAVAADGA